MRSSLYSYVDLEYASILEDPRTETVLDILKDADPKVLDFMSRTHPFGMIRLTGMIADALIGKVPGTTSFREVTIEEVPIYDLSPIGRLMCVGIGRRDHNQLRPRCLIGEQSHLSVSREHGVIYLKDGQLMYRDIGTYRRGSTNGTTLNGKDAFFNTVIRWQPGDYLGLGGSLRKHFRMVNDDGSLFRVRFIAVGAFRSIEPTHMM